MLKAIVQWHVGMKIGRRFANDFMLIESVSYCRRPSVFRKLWKEVSTVGAILVASGEGARLRADILCLTPGLILGGPMRTVQL